MEYNSTIRFLHSMYVGLFRRVDVVNCDTDCQDQESIWTNAKFRLYCVDHPEPFDSTPLLHFRLDTKQTDCCEGSVALRSTSLEGLLGMICHYNRCQVVGWHYWLWQTIRHFGSWFLTGTFYHQLHQMLRLDWRGLARCWSIGARCWIAVSVAEFIYLCSRLWRRS